MVSSLFVTYPAACLLASCVFSQLFLVQTEVASVSLHSVASDIAHKNAPHFPVLPGNRCKKINSRSWYYLSYKLWHLSLREVAVRSLGLSLAHLL